MIFFDQMMLLCQGKKNVIRGTRKESKGIVVGRYIRRHSLYAYRIQCKKRNIAGHCNAADGGSWSIGK